MSHNCQGDQAEGVEQSKQPTLCANGCGFFANPACNNMCSKCYRDSQLVEERKASNSKAAVAAFSDVQQIPEIKEVVAEKLPEGQVMSNPQPQPSAKSETPETVPSPNMDPATSGNSGDPPVSSSAGAGEPPQRPQQKNLGRCYSCNKKVGLTGFKCRCGYVFCGSHRLAEAHECPFDYKQIGRQRLAESNPLIQAAKMDKM